MLLCIASAQDYGPPLFHQHLQVVLLLVGINNHPITEPWKKLDFLLNEWFPAAMPTTKLLVVAPLPSKKMWFSQLYTYHDTLREQYECVCARQGCY